MAEDSDHALVRIDHGTTRVRVGEDMLHGVYGLTFIGAAVYYIGHAATFGAGVLGFLKAIVWPALLIYKVFEMLNMQ